MTTLSHLHHAFRPYFAWIAAPLGVYALYKLLCRCVPGPQHQRRLNLRNRTVVITGASAGLGRALAFVFYERVCTQLFVY